MSPDRISIDAVTVASVLAACSCVAATSQVGALLARVPREALPRWVPRLLALAIGVLITEALFHLLPESLAAGQGAMTVALLCLAGMGLAAGLSALPARRRQGRIVGVADAVHVRPALVSDGAHNVSDGLLIAASFSIDPALGVAATLTVIAHELPQELGDIGILLDGQRPLGDALRLNLFAALMIFPGAIAGLALGSATSAVMGWIGPVIAGGFLYLVGASLLPRLLRHPPRRTRESLLWIVIGAIGVLGVGLAEHRLLPHTSASHAPDGQ